jgi:glycosyltransferase involved in cell wall biosynthesis
LGTWSKQVDAFIALTDFQRDKMVEAGLPSDRVFVKPNFYSGNPIPLKWEDRGNYAVFAGRLSSEKGVHTLVQAWLAMDDDFELHVLGDGPLRDAIFRLAQSRPHRPVRFLGQVSSKEAEREIAQAKLLIVPSECIEGFPMVIREAFAFGTPVAVSDIGPLPAIIRNGECGVIFQPGNVDSLREQVQRSCRVPGLLEQLARRARKAFEESYTEDINYQTLVRIYEAALSARRPRSGTA